MFNQCFCNARNYSKLRNICTGATPMTLFIPGRDVDNSTDTHK